MPDKFFLRFRWADPTALTAEIAEARAAYAAARSSNDVASEIDEACRLGVALIADDKEAEAERLLAETLPKARQRGAPEPIARTLLFLATARQYLGDRPGAHEMFAVGLALAAHHRLSNVEHYLWHHRGRCYAEDRDIPNARACFEKALTLRLALGEPRAESSRRALAELANL